MTTKKKLELKKGDIVWTKLPMKAKIIRVNQRLGYTLQTDDCNKTEWSYYDDKDVQKSQK